MVEPARSLVPLPTKTGIAQTYQSLISQNFPHREGDLRFGRPKIEVVEHAGSQVSRKRTFRNRRVSLHV